MKYSIVIAKHYRYEKQLISMHVKSIIYTCAVSPFLRKIGRVGVEMFKQGEGQGLGKVGKMNRGRVNENEGGMQNH